jgi:hypothetical protein
MHREWEILLFPKEMSKQNGGLRIALAAASRPIME